MDFSYLRDKITKQKTVIILYLIVAVVLITLGATSIGYSVKNNAKISIDFTKMDKAYNKNLCTRVYSESYDLSVVDDIQIDSLAVSYMANDARFKGILTASISEGDDLLKSISVNIGSTSELEEFAIANIDFGVGTQLLKNCNYTLHIQIDTNQQDYYIKEYDISDGYDSLCKFSSDRIIVSNIGYTRISPMKYNEIFYRFVPFLIIIGGLFVLKKLDISLTESKYIGGILAFVQKHYNEMILILMFIYLALYEFYYAYVNGTYISQDSANYLAEAEAILAGYGFNQTGLSGYSSWFATWPIGYPLLIAVVAFVTGQNVYLSSKILAVVLVATFLLILYIKFRKNAWIYSFCLLNAGFLTIYRYSWSENPFCLGLLIFCLILTHIIEVDTVKIRWFVLLGFSSVFLFLCRYFGTFSFLIIGFVFIMYLGMYILNKKYRNKVLKAKIIGFVISEMISGLCIGNYYIMNYIMAGSISGYDRTEWWDEYAALTNNLWTALLAEFFNATRLAMPDVISRFYPHYKIGIVMLFLSAVWYMLYKHKTRDFRMVFIIVGILYDVFFIFIRYHSSMDGFSYRFFSPATMLITIGIFGFFSDSVDRRKYVIAPIVICMLILSSKVLLDSCKAVNQENIAYKQLQTTLENAVVVVPYNSTILGSDVDYRTPIFRPDIHFVAGTIGVDTTMNELFMQYNNSDYICIKGKYIKEILFSPIYDYDESIVDFFIGNVTENTLNDEYIVISVRERQIVNGND